MFPELQITGYPPEDLVLKPEFVRRSMEASERLIDSTAGEGPAILFGSIPSLPALARVQRIAALRSCSCAGQKPTFARR